MCALLKKDDVKKPPEHRPMTEALLIGGKSYRNSAAKFWPSLIDEILADFPACSRIELEALSSGELEWRHLYPQLALKDLSHLEAATIREEMNNAIAELELFGPPGSIKIRLYGSDAELFSGELPLDSIDADNFSFLLVWLLKWMAVPLSSWNNELHSGRIEATDKARKLVYGINASITGKHLSEGLYRRSIAVSGFSRSQA